MVTATGEQIGIMETKEALRLAQEQGVDLVQITQKADPPVCKLIEYGKFLYQQKKKTRQGQKKGAGQVKSVRISFNISEHDLETRARKVQEFLQEGYKVRIELPLRGRENLFKELGKEKVERFLERIREETEYKVDRELKKEPRGWSVIIVAEK